VTALRASPPILPAGTFYGTSLRRLPELPFAWVELDESERSPVPLHVHAAAHVCFLVSGAYHAESAAGVVGSPTVLFHPAGTRHRDRFLSERGRCLTLSFEGAWLAELFERTLPARSTALALPEVVASAFRVLCLGRRGQDDSPALVEGATIELLARFAPRSFATGRSAPPWIGRAQGFLRENHARPLRVPEVAAEVGVHPVVLARGFRRFLGCAPLEFLRQVRAGEAARRLGASRSLAELALSTGHADQPQFTKSFRRAIGITPGRLRDELEPAAGSRRTRRHGSTSTRWRA